MRIGVFITGIQICFTLLLTAADGKSQSITLHMRQAPVKQVFSGIEKQAGCSFAYNQSILKGLPPINISITEASLNEALRIIAAQVPLHFKQAGRIIGVSLKNEDDTTRSSVTAYNMQSDISRPVTISGRVTDEEGSPLQGVSVQLVGGVAGTYTDVNGRFKITVPEKEVTLQFSFIGYNILEMKVTGQILLNVVLKKNDGLLENVSVSTGYQTLPKERATGSFVQIDNKLLNRSVSTNILDRLSNVTSGLVFNANTSTSNRGLYDINIRGRSTIYANDQPLIVLDNFPYEGDINTINPNDVETITVLKDAAAASIWGARASNGVIVITTKKGKLKQPLKVRFNSNLTVGSKPDMFYNPYFMSSSDFIDVEKMLFQQGFYTADEESRTKPVLSPVVELLILERDGKLETSEMEAKLNILRNTDVRADFDNYVYRRSYNQQYAINLNGGIEKAAYNVSIGYDKNVSNIRRNQYDRFTVSSFNTFSPIKKLEITAAINYVFSALAQNNSGWGSDPRLSTISVATNKNIYPYAQLADENGNPLSLYKSFRAPFLDTLSQGHLLDWKYRPLEDIALSDNVTKLNDIRINTGARYTFSKAFNADVKYQNQRSLSRTGNLNSIQSYFTRNLINQYTLPATPEYIMKIPLGDILDQIFSDINSYSLRGQLNYDELLKGKHRITAIVGGEIREVKNKINQYRLYGYDAEHTLPGKVDYATNVNKVFPYTNNNQPIPNIDELSELLDRYQSVYANASYVYDKRYIASGSLRKDASNLFGVNTNQRTVPLWSTGIAWNIANEQFYHSAWLPYLKFRATYGYNGNINKSVTAYTTAVFTRSSITGLTNAIIRSPANENLRWERVGVFNLGLDFALKSQALSGSIEYYVKKGQDLFGDAILAPATGSSTFRTNISDSKGNGIDLMLNSRIPIGFLTWTGNFLFSHTTDKVTDLKATFGSASYVSYSDGVSQIQSAAPREGFPVYSIFSYRWAGLDENGDPQGYLNNEVSKDYSAIRNSTPLQELVYHGPARPTVFGSFRNELAYQSLAVSFNISYKMGYYFRRSSISYSDLFSNWIGHQDYYKRWQQPGDELHTSVPSLRYPDVNDRSFFYSYSSALVEKGDHIRLQDVSINYMLLQSKIKQLPAESINIYTYINNIGILWRANKEHLDPDASVFPAPTTYAVGLTVNF